MKADIVETQDSKEMQLTSREFDNISCHKQTLRL